MCVNFTKLDKYAKREISSTHHRPAISWKTELQYTASYTAIVVSIKSSNRKLTIFITPYRRYYFKSLPFEISSRPEIFSQEITHILFKIPGVICDICRWCPDKKKKLVRAHPVTKSSTSENESSRNHIKWQMCIFH